MILSPGGMILTPAERQSPVWANIEEYYKKRLVELRAKNDAELTEAKTAHMRGRIEEVKAILALGRESIAEGEVPQLRVGERILA